MLSKQDCYLQDQMGMSESFVNVQSLAEQEAGPSVQV